MSLPRQRAVDLLVDRATEGLEPRLEAELEGLLTSLPDLDPESFERAAAAIDLAYTRPLEPLPAGLRRHLERQAREEFARQASLRDETRTPATVVDFSTTPKAAETARPSSHRWIGWAVAAAAVLVAIAGWWPQGEPSLSPDAARAELVAEAPDLLELAWTATEDPAAAGAGGDLVWSTALQQGYMRFRGLPANDPTVEQYQLWIFDAGRDDRYPVDGGVFDVPSGGEAVVPIRPKLRVDEPTLFAVTVEKPGGVVVSSRERLPLLAQVS